MQVRWLSRTAIGRRITRHTEYLPLPYFVDTGIFNLELCWRDLNGSLHNKLNWAQIMADRGNITLSIVDSTLATHIHNLTDEVDVERGGGVDPSLLLLQRDTYFHMDVFRMDQVIRNIITNAVSYLQC